MNLKKIIAGYFQIENFSKINKTFCIFLLGKLPQEVKKKLSFEKFDNNQQYD
jgi:hypothetical protein